MVHSFRLLAYAISLWWGLFGIIHLKIAHPCVRQGSTGRHCHKPYFTSVHFPAMPRQLNVWSVNTLHPKSKNFRSMSGQVCFLWYDIDLPESLLVWWVLRASTVDTFHICLLSQLFWNFLVVGRFVGLSVLFVTLPWFVCYFTFLFDLNTDASLGNYG